MAKVKAYDPTKQEWIPWASNEAAGIITLKIINIFFVLQRKL